MASRGIALGRIIDWFKSADYEETLYVLHRAEDITQTRAMKVNQADASHQVKRVRRTKKQLAAAQAAQAGLPSGADLNRVEEERVHSA